MEYFLCYVCSVDYKDVIVRLFVGGTFVWPGDSPRISCIYPKMEW